MLILQSQLFLSEVQLCALLAFRTLSFFSQLAVLINRQLH